MANQALAGVLAATLDGLRIPVMETATLSLNTTEKTSQVGASGYYGHTVKNTPAGIELDVSDVPDIDSSVVVNFSGTALQIDLINNRSYVLHKPVQIMKVDLDAIKGTYKVRFEGSSITVI